LPNADSLASASAVVVRQWLLFEPLREVDAVALFNDLVARMPVLALRKQWALRIPELPLQKSPPEHKGRFNGPMPTLVPSEFTPLPAWVEVQASRFWDGESVLGAELAARPAVVDERIRTAMDETGPNRRQGGGGFYCGKVF
jgi:hypothetical protein